MATLVAAEANLKPTIALVGDKGLSFANERCLILTFILETRFTSRFFDSLRFVAYLNLYSKSEFQMVSLSVTFCAAGPVFCSSF